jgi:hypothetical protein
METQMLLVGVDGTEVFTEEMLETPLESACLQHNLEVARNYGRELGRLLGKGTPVATIVQMIKSFAVGLTAEYDLDENELQEIRELCAQVAAGSAN